MTKMRVLIERIDGRIQHYNVREETLDQRGYVETSQYFRDEPSVVWSRFPEREEAPTEEPIEDTFEKYYEVVLYTEYKQKHKTRNERYELRTTVRASDPMEAVERGISKMTRVIPDDHGSYLDALGIYGVGSNESSHEIYPSEAYRGVKYHRFNAGGERPAEPRYTWDREGEE